MKRDLLKLSGLSFLAALLIVASGCMRPPTEKPVYREAKRAIEAVDTLPDGAKVQPIAKSKLYIGKSAARADLLVEYSDGAGNTVESWYTVPLKRVARTWVAQDASPRPDASSYSDRKAVGESTLPAP